MSPGLMIAIVAFMLVAGCSESPTGSGPSDEFLEPEYEAQAIASAYAGTLQPERSTWRQVRSDLEKIRTQFGSTYPELSELQFRPPWKPGCVVIHFDGPTAEAVRDGNYTAWDHLNEEYGIERIQLQSIERGSCEVSSGRALNPWRMRDAYAGLPGVTSAFPNHTIADHTDLYPRLVEHGNTYLFSSARGNHAPSYTAPEYWYFRMRGGQPEFVGRRGIEDADPNPPLWWEEALLNIEQHHALIELDVTPDPFSQPTLPGPETE